MVGRSFLYCFSIFEFQATVAPSTELSFIIGCTGVGLLLVISCIFDVLSTIINRIAGTVA